MVRLGSPSIDVDVRHDDRFITWHVLTLIMWRRFGELFGLLDLITTFH